jgi:hypothetical protein
MAQKYKVQQALNACAERLDSLNQSFPDLASPTTEEAVSQWNRIKVSLGLNLETSRDSESQEKDSEDPGYESRKLAIELLENNGLEEVRDILQTEHALTLNMPKLVQLIGNAAYRDALKKDAEQMLQNAITYEQIANLWNDLERPAFEAPNWNPRNVSVLMS